MADGENFEDDLFADLYDDNDASKPSAGSAPAAAAPAPVEPKTEGAGDSGMKQHEQDEDEEEEDDDDDVDFNLGGDAGSTSITHNMPKEEPQPEPAYEQPRSPGQYGSVHKASAKDEGKMFIGGLNWETTDESLRDYFSQFGEVVECTVMRDSATGRSRGFGFLTFKEAKTVNIVMVKEHFLDGKIIDPKRAIPRDEQEKTSKIFVGGVSQDTTDQEFREYFAQFGRVVDATLMMDKDTGRPRGFGFVTFESEAGVDACINVPLEIHGKPIEVKKAQPRGNLREEEDAAKRNKFQRNDQGSGMGQGMGNGMTPQVMAQYFQRMQQYFQMMQGQMAMRGMGQMNPQMMMQMQQMQQMQQQMMGRGGQGMQNMNPQQMQQMQQMQQQMQQQMMNQGGGGGQGFDGGFQGQQPQHQGGGPGRRGGRGGGYGGGGYGGGQGGYGGGQQQGGNAYEGMYDDAPREGNAPPANAPTGPKNAGRPGANYRGGGRGGNRGFHPYAR